MKRAVRINSLIVGNPEFSANGFRGRLHRLFLLMPETFQRSGLRATYRRAPEAGDDPRWWGVTLE